VIVSGCKSYRYLPPSRVIRNETLVQGGSDGKFAVYLCRANLFGHIILGKAILTPILRCWLPHDGKEYLLYQNFEILSNVGNAKMKWIRGSGQVILNGSVPGGRTADGETLYVARFSHSIQDSNKSKRIFVPGYVTEGNPKIMKYSYGHKEKECKSNYEVLVCE